MTQYLLAVHHDPADGPVYATDEEMAAAFAAVDAWNKVLQDGGHWVFAGGLEPIESSTTVDATGSDVIVTDGPFSETKEYLGGFWVIEAADLDVALELAAEGSRACGNKVEVRPFQGA